MLIPFLNFLIFSTIIITFLTLIAGLIYTSKSGEDTNNKINKFMRYRVYFQFLAIVILVVAIYYKQKLVG
tara:strand:- start:150 stop:359 length:210 start_codon:yes stop_codon:yes gene_type:complete